jgi:LysR family transcriptional regulator, glycine cleavage system transcriptional activator
MRVIDALVPNNSYTAPSSVGPEDSFKLAAQELNLTPSAVSHGIKSLEKWLISDRIERTAPGLTPTMRVKTRVS